MTHTKFRLINTTLRFDDKLMRPSRHREDKLAPIRSLWEKWTHHIPMLFNPGEDVCVDEQLVLFRGRCKFRQYIPSKPAKYGLKIWVTADVETSYAWKCQIYTGKTAGSAAEVRQRAALSSLFGFTKNTTAMSYIPKRVKNVILLSSKHRDPAVTEHEKRKPVIIADYNHCKGGIDNLDKVVGSYSCRRMTHRWPQVLFYNMIDVSAFNAFLLFTAVDPSWKQANIHPVHRLLLP
ncbi:PiggyBac transposable element-derived protein 4 [Dissostichus eleginoides]|uniref:PiggyBac transposable element-derived protein 4 n=1 Tax=Dissostichus eleginoides TaxID=100907 RepID=A0AAD9BES5_DISEL|nr:PiggyBac transposable element-derived protein 4 [Dissostichus eleginoides]